MKTVVLVQFHELHLFNMVSYPHTAQVRASADSHSKLCVGKCTMSSVCNPKQDFTKLMQVSLT
jgi:hypothetical protein